MSMEVANATTSLGQWASNKGAVDLIDAAQDSAVLEKFFETGVTEDVPAVRSALLHIASATEWPDVATSAKELAKLILGQEIAVITDGVVADHLVAKSVNYWGIGDSGTPLYSGVGYGLGSPLQKISHAPKLERTIHGFLQRAAEGVISKLGRLYKANKPKNLDAVVTIRWNALVPLVEDDLSDEIVESAGKAITSVAVQLKIDPTDMISKVNKPARDWARDRAAELVGMRRTKGGALITNPNAKYAIDETTRDELREIITDAFKRESTVSELAQLIRDAGSFSDARARLIANTESARAMNAGNLLGWREMGVVEEVKVVLGGDHDIDDECDDLVDNGPYDIDDAPELPAHPGCRCLLRPTRIKGLGDVDEGEAFEDAYIGTLRKEK